MVCAALDAVCACCRIVGAIVAVSHGSALGRLDVAERHGVVYRSGDALAREFAEIDDAHLLPVDGVAFAPLLVLEA